VASIPLRSAQHGDLAPHLRDHSDFGSILLRTQDGSFSPKERTRSTTTRCVAAAVIDATCNAKRGTGQRVGRCCALSLDHFIYNPLHVGSRKSSQRLSPNVALRADAQGKRSSSNIIWRINYRNDVV
jgi:hypothetical protein